mgnify:CR=1 FL=1
MRKKTRNYLTKFVIFLAVFMTASNMISMFFKNATTSEWILTIVISLIAAKIWIEVENEKI